MPSPQPSTRRVRLHVTGRVQGVGFRYFTLSVGRNLGVSGWVKNEPDGSVSVEAEGESAAIEQLLLQVRQGPAHARVEHVSVADLPPSGAGGGFEIAR